MTASSIQEMVKAPIHSVPDHFLVHPDPAISETPPHCSIPVLDLQNLRANHDIHTFHSVCKDWGIFQLVNHGVDTSVMKTLKQEIHEFYKLPMEDRLNYKIHPGEVEGYGQTVILSEGQKIDWADRFYIITNPLHIRKPHLLPNLPPSLREALEAYISELQKLTMALFGLIAEALKIDTTEMAEMFEHGMQSMRMNYYPPCPEPDKVIGLTPHSDACGITVLLQVNGVEGLQVKKDGIWMPVNILPDAFVVNLGDIVEILSNGLYKSIEHRATVNSEKERISIAMFFSPKLEADVGPAAAMLTDGQAPHFRRMKTEHYAKNFFSRKLNGKSYLQNMKNM